MAPRLLLLLSLFLLVACGGPATTVDAGGMDGGPLDAGAADTGLPDAPDAAAHCTTDADGDGHISVACGGDDCDDTDPGRFPGHAEVCDMAGRDEDCNPTTLGPDGDGDGFASTGCCNRDAGGILHCGTDCDDARMTVSPTAIESCNGVDDDCNGSIDEGVTMMTCYVDGDADSYALAAAPSHMACACTSTETTRAPTGASAIDCDDANAGAHPGATDICDLVDNDCNGAIDDGAGAAYYADCDADGFGVTARSMPGCTVPTTPPTCPSGGTGVWVVQPADCDDTRMSVHPGASDICNGVDDDCNTTVDDASSADPWCNDASRALLHATARCSSAGCVVASCMGSYADCSASAGCESDTATDVAHCGSCAHACAHPSAGCAASVCQGDFVELSLTQFSSCGRRGSGRVDCWGASSAAPPHPQPGAPLAVQISAVDALAREASGQVLSWGGGMYPGCAPGSCPGPVLGVGDAIDVASSDSDACVVHASGTLGCWGSNYNGELGDGTTTAHDTPVLIPGLTDVVQAAVGERFICARRMSGAVACLGANGSCQIGDGLGCPVGTPDRTTPSRVSGLSDAIQVVAGGQFACALRAGGSVVCWGNDGYGQIGDGGGCAASVCATPTPVSGLTDAVEIAAGDQHACARRASGAMVCWGDNGDRQLGDPSALGRVPVAVVGVANAVAIAAGYRHTCAVLANGNVECWGDNSSGQIGDGTTSGTRPPTVVIDP